MTSHIQEKYTQWAKRTKEAIEERFPMIKVFLKQNLTNKEKPNILDHYTAAKTLGAFEVILVEKNKKNDGRMDEITRIFSKLKQGNWPRISYVLEKLSHRVPRGTLVVQLFDDDEKKVLAEEREARFKDL